MEGQPSAQPASKRRNLRVTTGCLTCRRRHVKCDETRPACFNCGKKNRACSYARARTPGDYAVVATPPATRGPNTPQTGRRQATPDEVCETSVREPSEIPEPEPILESPSREEEDVVSPFSATLGSILLGAEYYPLPASDSLQPNDTELDRSDHVGNTAEFPSQQLHVGYQIQLSRAEVAIFRNYVENVCHWVDSFSPDHPFHRQVPTLALTCPPLLHACLAFAAKQMDLVGAITSLGISASEPVRYYRLALTAIRSLLLHPDYARSDEVLATCILLSTYEMVDVVGDSLGSHLTGVASLLRTRQVNGDVSGIRGSCYWTWYRHETWAALRTGRRMSLDEQYWKPPELESFDHLGPEDIANRIVFIFGQCINFCNDYDPIQSAIEHDEWSRAREAEALSLEKALDDWKTKLPPSMTSFISGIAASNIMSPESFEAMWFMYPHGAVATQVYNASKIILTLNKGQTDSARPGLVNCAFLTTQRRIESYRRQIFLTANSRIPDAWGLISTQCLYIAGLVTEGIQERRRTLDLIDQCQYSSGRKTGVLSDDLRRLWSTGIEQ